VAGSASQLLDRSVGQERDGLYVAAVAQALGTHEPKLLADKARQRLGKRAFDDAAAHDPISVEVGLDRLALGSGVALHEGAVGKREAQRVTFRVVFRPHEAKRAVIDSRDEEPDGVDEKEPAVLCDAVLA